MILHDTAVQHCYLTVTNDKFSNEQPLVKVYRNLATFIKSKNYTMIAILKSHVNDS